MCTWSTLDAVGWWAMRTFVGLLVWGTSVSACLWVITPACDSLVAGVFFSAVVLWFAWRTTVFYLLTANTDPGRVPADWAPSADELRVLQSIVGPKGWAEIRDAKQLAFCKHCQRHRPLRSHHCSDWKDNCLSSFSFV
jgi:hypothetical protein